MLINIFIKWFYLIPIIGFFGCENKTNKGINDYYSADQSETLITNIVTYISKKPKTATWKTRHQSEFRQFYIRQTQYYNLKNFFVSKDSLHYFYMIRPARSPKGNIRGVGGKFKVDKDLEIIEFEEVFNTPVMPYDSLCMVGELLFTEMYRKGNIDSYLKDKTLVEWPDERLKYDKTINDWKYLD